MLDTELRKRLDALKSQLEYVSSFRHVQLALLEMVDLIGDLRCAQEDPVEFYDTGSGATMVDDEAETVVPPEVVNVAPEDVNVVVEPILKGIN
tara:strand:- start:143 stop:421 length:279 start_codon:yes stop_codon:yes gene_type:complete